MTLEELQKALRELMSKFVTGKIDLEEWKEKSDAAFTVFRQSLAVPVDLKKQAKTYSQLLEQRIGIYCDALCKDTNVCFPNRTSGCPLNRKFISLDVVQQFLMELSLAKERSLRKLWAKRPILPSFYPQNQSEKKTHDQMLHDLTKCFVWFEKAEKVFDETFTRKVSEEAHEK